MTNPLTGDYEAAVQIAIRRINALPELCTRTPRQMPP